MTALRNGRLQKFTIDHLASLFRREFRFAETTEVNYKRKLCNQSYTTMFFSIVHLMVISSCLMQWCLRYMIAVLLPVVLLKKETQVSVRINKIYDIIAELPQGIDHDISPRIELDFKDSGLPSI